MDYKDKTLCRVRTITTFVVLDKDRATWQKAITAATRFCNDLARAFGEEGYVVQSIRIVTNPFGEYLDTASEAAAQADLAFITELLNTPDKDDLRIRFAIGEARTPEEIKLLPELIKA
ncbi:MAG: DUF711 family protein, partial [Desulfobacterales bacterium]|nr:DUF711 family protein [Desulfobacterales bacterium]